jgi:spermidine synthase
VGGLGLGYTAQEALKSAAVTRVDVVEFLPQVIGWMKNGLVPLSDELNSEPRYSVMEGDVYAMLAETPELQYDLILIDVDHSPDETLADANAAFYTEAGLRAAKEHLRPGGLLGVWSYADSSPFATALRAVFSHGEIEPVAFDNELTGEEETNWLFLAVND